MKLGIDRFMSFFKHGIANPSRYNVSFTLPRGIPAFEGSAVESQAGNIRGWDSRLHDASKKSYDLSAQTAERAVQCALLSEL